MYIYLVKVAVTSTGKKEKKLRPRNDEHLAQPGDPEMPSTLNSGGPRNAEYGLNLGDPEMPSTLSIRWNAEHLLHLVGPRNAEYLVSGALGRRPENHKSQG